MQRHEHTGILSCLHHYWWCTLNDGKTQGSCCWNVKHLRWLLVISLYCALASTMQQVSWWIPHEGYGHCMDTGLHPSTPCNSSPFYCIVGQIGRCLRRPHSAQWDGWVIFCLYSPRYFTFFMTLARERNLRDKGCKINLAFIADITVHLNKLNL